MSLIHTFPVFYIQMSLSWTWDFNTWCYPGFGFYVLCIMEGIQNCPTFGAIKDFALFSEPNWNLSLVVCCLNIPQFLNNKTSTQVMQHLRKLTAEPGGCNINMAQKYNFHW